MIILSDFSVFFKENNRVQRKCLDPFFNVDNCKGRQLRSARSADQEFTAWNCLNRKAQDARRAAEELKIIQGRLFWPYIHDEVGGSGQIGRMVGDHVELFAFLDGYSRPGNWDKDPAVYFENAR